MNATRRVSSPFPVSVSVALVLGAAAAQTPTWTNMAPQGPTPAGRYGHVLCPLPGGALLFGGHNGSFLGDTWIYTAATNTWSQVATPTAPSPRRWAAAAFHEGDGRVYLFGGDGAAGNSNQTWRFDGTAWSQVTGTGPSARSGAAMAYDSGRGRLVLFGGSNLSDTWEFGTSWTQRTNVGSPGAHTYAGMAYDRRRLRVVLHCGALPGAVNDNRTFDYDGTAWVQQPGTYGPAGLAGPSVAYDGSRGRVVSFGGLSGGTTTQSFTFEHVGSAWIQRLVPVAPLARYGSMAAYIPGFGTLVFGGASGGGGVYGDTRRYAMAQPASYVQAVAGCSPIVLEAHDPDHAPWLGDTFYRRAFVPGVQLCVFATGAGSQLVDMTGAGLTGCTLGSTATVLTVHLSTNAAMEFPLAIPNDPALHGFVFSDQLAVFQPGVNPAGIVLSNAMTGTCRGK
jgi:hypothetical protein